MAKNDINIRGLIDQIHQIVNPRKIWKYN